MLADLTVKDFLDKVACSDPVPGGSTAHRRKKGIRSQ